jgi:glutathione S-transferase
MSSERRRAPEIADLQLERFFARQRREIMARIDAHEARRRTRGWLAAAAAAAAGIAVAVLGLAGLSGPDIPAVGTAWLELPVFAEPVNDVADPLEAFGAWPEEQTATSPAEETESLGILEWDEPLS